jgi:nitrite reductase/ring-hydroxylating ferredoxin subunit
MNLISFIANTSVDIMAFVKIVKASVLTPGLMELVEAAGRKIVAVNVGGVFYAFDDRCPHMGGHLSKGLLFGAVVQCPLHGSKFDVRTGSVVEGPAKAPVKTYPVKVEGDDVLADL